MLKLCLRCVLWFYRRTGNKRIKDMRYCISSKISAYIDKLKGLDMEQILEDIYDLEGMTDSEVIFLCYEKSDDFCHRHILRDILNYKYHIRIEEFPYPEKKKEYKVQESKSLF